MADIFDQITAGQTPSTGDIFDQIAPATQAAAPTATISAAPQSAADRFISDLKYGTDLTPLGGVLKKMGARGLYSGNSQAVGDFMGSVPLGVSKVAKGVGEQAQGQFSEGGKDMLSGAVQAATIPSMIVAPEGAAAAADAIPSAARARSAIEHVEAAAGHIPVPVNQSGIIGLEARQLASSGGQMPKVIKDFLRRVTDPAQGPLTLKEARDFYSNATRLSANEFNSLTPKMQRQVGRFTEALNGEITKAADAAGLGDKYQGAMSEFHNAMRMARTAKTLAKTALGGTAAYELYNRLYNRLKP